MSPRKAILPLVLILAAAGGSYYYTHRPVPPLVLTGIVTTNDVGETLAQRMSEDRAAPLLRRLREFCTVISFSRQAEGIIQLDRGTY